MPGPGDTFCEDAPFHATQWFPLCASARRKGPMRSFSPNQSGSGLALLSLLAMIGFQILSAQAEGFAVDEGFHHLRNREPREWDHFPPRAEASRYGRTFDLDESFGAYQTLTLRQADIKQTWTVTLNGRKLGTLNRDDNDLEHFLPVPSETLKREGNRLEVATTAEAADDIRLGEVYLHHQSRGELAREATVSVSVRDAESGLALPCRLTVVDAESGHLVMLGAASNDRLAVRPGVVYTLDGQARFGIDAGRYRIWAGRGFEYALAESEFVLLPGETREIALTLRREVETPGLVACDTHLHTNEFARHGDATLIERLITLAGEGVELPISTEHDQHIDYEPEARRIGARRHFTPVLGCEVTTALGHFNSFPIAPESAPAQHRLREWPQIFDNIFRTPGVRVAILNHPRDLHGGFRPLDPAHFDAATGRFTDGRILRANGMEVINSGAQQSEPMQLVHDWMALLKSGHQVAAVGSSDSHTVNFAIAGQARTYIPCPDDDPGAIDVETAVENFLAGQTHVSFGLLTLLQRSGPNRVTARVLGPGWTRATSLTLFENGEVIHRETIPADDGSRAGLKHEKSWEFDGESADARFLVAVARGPGIAEPYWRMIATLSGRHAALQALCHGHQRAPLAQTLG